MAFLLMFLCFFRFVAKKKQKGVARIFYVRTITRLVRNKISRYERVKIEQGIDLKKN